MKFPASDKEKQLVFEKADELVKHLESAGQCAADLSGLLHENFLALHEEYRKRIFAAVTKINEKEWRIKIQRANLLASERQERVINSP